MAHDPVSWAILMRPPSAAHRTNPLLHVLRQSTTVHLHLRRHELLLTPWPALDAYSRRRGTTTWHPMRDARHRLPRLEALAAGAQRVAFQLDLFETHDVQPGEALALSQLLAQIPPFVRNAVAAYRTRQHPLLQLAGADPRAWQLLLAHRYGGNPGLAFALAQRLAATPEPADRMRLRALVTARRPVIARAIGFPGNRTALRALSRVRPEEVEEHLPPHLAMALDCEAALPWLRRLERTSTVASCLLWRWRRLDLLTIAFLHDCADYYGSAAPMLLHQLRRYVLRRSRAGRALRRVQSVDELRALAGDDEREMRLPPFPQPPLARCDVGQGLRLVPLTTPQALAGEGREMDHCIARHADRIARYGDLYAYRLEGSERGSVLLERRNGCWRVVEMRGVRNCPLSESTRQLVRAAVVRAQRRP